MFNKKNVIVLSSLCVVGAAIGGVGGWFLGSMFKPVKDIQNETFYDKPIEYSNKQETTALVLKTLNIDDESFGTVDVTSAVGKNGITAADLAEVALYRIYKNDSFRFYSENTAESDAGIMVNVQNTDSTFVKVNDCYFKENVSTSDTVNFAERYSNYDQNQVKNPLIPIKSLENEIDYYRMIDRNQFPDRRANFSGTPKQKYFANVPEGSPEGTLSFSTYFGISAYSAYNYEFKSEFLLTDENGNVKEQTIRNSRSNKEEVFDNSIVATDYGYELKIPVSGDACKQYAAYTFKTTRDQTKLANMAKLPTYEQLGLKIHVDKNFNLIDFSTVEFYYVYSAMGMTVPTYCTSDIKVYYENIELPLLGDITSKGE